MRFTILSKGKRGSPPKPVEPPTDEWQFEDLPVQEAPPEFRNVTLRSTKTHEEIERDWGHMTPIFGYLMAEVEYTLGIFAEELEKIRAGEIP